MAAITREMLERAEHVRVLYVEYQKILRESVKAGARLAPGCDAILDRAALNTEIPAFTVDLSRFGAKWTTEMKTLLVFPGIDRKRRLKLFRAHLHDFNVMGSAALRAHNRSLYNHDNWDCAQIFMTQAIRLHVAIFGLRIAGWMFWARLPRAANVAERSVDVLQEFLTVMRPIATVVSIR